MRRLWGPGLQRGITPVRVADVVLPPQFLYSSGRRGAGRYALTC
jgi:hypothetical protein